MLALEIEFLTGVYRGAIGRDSGEPDWPPQPDRIFSALVAAWGSRGEDADEAKALEWLEQLPVPLIVAPHAFARTAPEVFVPVNDVTIDPKVLHRPRQPRRFPSARPHQSVMHLVWTHAEPSSEVFDVLNLLANHVPYIGTSASIVRCRFRQDDLDGIGFDEAVEPKRCVYPGRLAELRLAFTEGRRPQPGALVTPSKVSVVETPRSHGGRYLILEHVAGDMPSLEHCALVARRIRRALMSAYRQTEGEDSIPQEISGHAPDGSPAQAAHLAIIPLPFAGFAHADGHVMGYALVPPGDGNILQDQEFRRALRKIAPIDEDRGRRIITINGKQASDGLDIQFSPAFDPPAGRISLNPEALYNASARTFATVTPIVLNRHPRKKGDAQGAEIIEQIVVACRHAGLPDPEDVSFSLHSSLKGVASVRVTGEVGGRHTNWPLPASMAGRRLFHAVIRFPSPINGPVLIGAGRYMGLGLCRPLIEGE
jgi:CRISPR-associated protein Csb2